MSNAKNNTLAHHLVFADRVASRFKAAFVGVGDTEEVGSVRIHRFRPSMKIWDLTFAGKRGKKVRVLTVLADGRAEEETMEQVAWALQGKKDFDSIKAILEKDFPGTFPEFPISLDMSEERGVDVMPAGFAPVKVKGKNVYVEVGLKEFVVKDLVDTNNEPTCIPAMSGGLKEIPAFYRWVKDNQSKITGMSFSDVQKVMGELGVKSHYFCAMD